MSGDLLLLFTYLKSKSEKFNFDLETYVDNFSPAQHIEILKVKSLFKAFKDYFLLLTFLGFERVN